MEQATSAKRCAVTAATQAQEALEAALKRKMGDVALGAIMAMSRAIRAYRKRKRRTLEINKYAAELWVQCSACMCSPRRLLSPLPQVCCRALGELLGQRARRGRGDAYRLRSMLGACDAPCACGRSYPSTFPMEGSSPPGGRRTRSTLRGSVPAAGGMARLARRPNTQAARGPDPRARSTDSDVSAHGSGASLLSSASTSDSGGADAHALRARVYD